MPVFGVGFDRDAKKTDCPDQLELIGPTAGCLIGFDPDYDPKGTTPPKLSPEPRMGLIDTGASHSSIDAELAQVLNLPIVDKKPVSGVHGEMMLDVCSAQIFLPLFGYTIYGLFAVVKLRPVQQHDALLGRVMLRGFTLYYDGASGYTRLAR
jgi:hypothetical protein